MRAPMPCFIVHIFGLRKPPSSALWDAFPTLLYDPALLSTPVIPSVITAPIFHCLVPLFCARSTGFEVPWTLLATS
ncbi:hypothetical protein CY34DRAFT_281006 [Suillus luteus UH-Slu-Lm8-n1]|uniref:Uncharacterized protein n=1 Tax=Suillus luteus UH-Slu-Lm8-n1 TaxID=930992 RepID=A0A0D0BBY1_9AGAM|nr:hypothetical protein CY34DRAFT_281006 [Suillus luteus UH-Slu-Lm8-n1]